MNNVTHIKLGLIECGNTQVIIYVVSLLVGAPNVFFVCITIVVYVFHD